MCTWNRGADGGGSPTTEGSATGPSAGPSGDASDRGWKPLNVALIAAAFAAFWPLGIVMLATGFQHGRGPVAVWLDGARRVASGMRTASGLGGPGAHVRASGNVALDEHLRAERDRLAEEARGLDCLAGEFGRYRDEARARADRAEFDAFRETRSV